MAQTNIAIQFMKQANPNSERADFCLDSGSIKRGDRVWVRIPDLYGNASHLRMAEVLSVMSIPYSKIISYATVHYLDDGDKMYECVPLEQVEGLCIEGLH